MSALHPAYATSSRGAYKNVRLLNRLRVPGLQEAVMLCARASTYQIRRSPFWCALAALGAPRTRPWRKHAVAPAVRTDGWVVIPVEEYRALRLKAYPPDRPADPPPVEATLTRVEYSCASDGDAASGEARLTVDVLKEGWVRVDIPAGLLVRAAQGGRPRGTGHRPAVAARAAVEARPRRAVARHRGPAAETPAGTEAFTLPASEGAVSRLGVVVPRADRSTSPSTAASWPSDRRIADGRWVAFGRYGTAAYRAVETARRERANDASVAMAGHGNRARWPR